MHPGNFVCHHEENYNHHTNLQVILARHKACKNGCAIQGAGTAGS